MSIYIMWVIRAALFIGGVASAVASVAYREDGHWTVDTLLFFGFISACCFAAFRFCDITESDVVR